MKYFHKKSEGIFFTLLIFVLNTLLSYGNAKPQILKYEKSRQIDKLKALCQKLYDSQDYISSLIDYNYNVLASIEKNGILFTNGDNDTYPIWLLQYVKYFRKDVLVLNINLSHDLIYLEKILKENNIHIDKEKLKTFDIQVVIKEILNQAPDRPIYLAVTVDNNYIKQFKENLYCIGLVNKYSQKRIDNIALLKKNLEKKYRLDYLRYDWYNENHISSDLMRKHLNTNYIPPIIMLVEHYNLSGENERSDHWLHFAKEIAEKSGNQTIIRFLKNSHSTAKQ